SVSPARRASSRVKGLFVSSGGMKGVRAMHREWAGSGFSPTYPVKTTPDFACLQPSELLRCPDTAWLASKARIVTHAGLGSGDERARAGPSLRRDLRRLHQVGALGPPARPGRPCA